MIKHMLVAAAGVLAWTAALAAQTATITQETKLKVEKGKEVTVTGCVTRSPSGTSIVLTDVESDEEDISRTYVLVPDEDTDLDDHIGELVEIRGRATDLDDESKVEVETRTEIDREEGDDKETETKTQIEGDLVGIPFLGIEAVKTIRSSCR